MVRLVGSVGAVVEVQKGCVASYVDFDAAGPGVGSLCQKGLVGGNRRKGIAAGEIKLVQGPVGRLEVAACSWLEMSSYVPGWYVLDLGPTILLFWFCTQLGFCLFSVAWSGGLESVRDFHSFEYSGDFVVIRYGFPTVLILLLTDL